MMLPAFPLLLFLILSSLPSSSCFSSSHPSSGTMWATYVRQLQTRPLTTKSITSGVLFGAGDVISQVVLRRAWGPSWIQRMRMPACSHFSPVRWPSLRGLCEAGAHRLALCVIPVRLCRTPGRAYCPRATAVQGRMRGAVGRQGRRWMLGVPRGSRALDWCSTRPPTTFGSLSRSVMSRRSKAGGIMRPCSRPSCSLCPASFVRSCCPSLCCVRWLRCVLSLPLLFSLLRCDCACACACE